MSSSVSNSNRTKTTASPLLERKIQETAAGLIYCYTKRLLSISNEDNTATIVNYISAMKIEINLSDHYRKDLIELLTRFSKFNNDRNFKDITHSDIIAFLDTYRKTETADPLHKWIGTYNIFTTHIIRFFRWLYHPEIEPKKRPKPPVVENIADVPYAKRRGINYIPLLPMISMNLLSGPNTIVSTLSVPVF